MAGSSMARFSMGDMPAHRYRCRRCRVALKGTGNAAVRRLGCKLKAAGLDDSEIPMTLRRNQPMLKKPEERERYILWHDKSHKIHGRWRFE